MSSTRRQQPRAAVALRYDGESAPRVTAKGSGELAERILALAAQHGVPIQGNAELTFVLSQIELGEEIPAALYVAVAEVLCFAYGLSGKPPPPTTAPHRDRSRRPS